MSKKILIVEDDSLFRNMLAEILNSAGYNTFRAKDGEEGLATFKASNPDLVVTDIRMPRKNGIQMSMDILRVSPKTPIIFISGWYDPERLYSENRESASFLKNDTFHLRFLKKPFHATQLLNMIREVLDPHKKHQAA